MPESLGKKFERNLSTQFEESHRLEEEIRRNMKAIGFELK